MTSPVTGWPRASNGIPSPPKPKLSSDTPAGDQGFAGPPPDSFTGYKITREIHRGGQGVVYMAIQQSTIRKVALKVMKEGPCAEPAQGWNRRASKALKG